MEESGNNDLVILNLMDELNNSDVLTDVVPASLEDLTLLKQLLEDWNLVQILPLLQAAGVTYRSLVYLSKDDIKDAILDIGLRAEFRGKLFLWRKDQHDIDDDTITYNSKVSSWLQKTSDQQTPSSSRTSTEHASKLSKRLSDLLNESNKGKAILQYYIKHSSLDKLRRETLVSIILEDIQYSGSYLSPKDYPPILNEIESTFPTEKDFRDYYFFSRNKRKNPGGRLYNKFVNSSAKSRKIEIPSHSAPSFENLNVLECQEFDIDILNSLKTSLQRECKNWTEVKDKWEKTFVLRQQELQKSDKANLVDFLKEWALYSHANSKDLNSSFSPSGTYCGKKYKTNLYLTVVENCQTKLYKIVYLIELSNNSLHILANEIEVKCFDYHFQSFEVGRCLNNLHLKSIQYFTSPPLHLYTSNNGKVYLRNKSL